MARWKLRRLTYRDDEYTFVEGEEITLGRAMSNTISISSIVISRYHCVLTAERDKVIIKDLGSSNGIYVGKSKIPANKPYSLKDSDVIGIGWTESARVTNIEDSEKYMFKLSKEIPLPNRITFQSDNELADIEAELADIDRSKNKKEPSNKQSPIHALKSPTKRKISEISTKTNVKKELEDNVINIISESENDEPAELPSKRLKFETSCEDVEPIKEEVKAERDDMEFDAFNVKQEYLGYDDGPIQIDSDSDDDGESVQWLIRLSQSSPGKPFIKAGKRESKLDNEESSYSQIDDFEDEEYFDDLITIPPEPPKDNSEIKNTEIEIKELNNEILQSKTVDTDEDYLDDLISLNKPSDTQFTAKVTKTDNLKDIADLCHTEQSLKRNENHVTVPQEKENTAKETKKDNLKDVVDGYHIERPMKINENLMTAPQDKEIDKVKRTLQIEPLVHAPKPKSSDSKHKSSSSRNKDNKKHSRIKHSSSRKHISNSQKEQRKNKLKEIANKEKELNKQKSNNDPNNTSKDKGIVNVKVTNTNRGAFLTNVVQGVVKPMTRKESPQKANETKEKSEVPSTANSSEPNKLESPDNVKNSKKPEKSKSNENKSKTKHKEKDAKSKSTTHKTRKSSNETESRVPLKNLKPLSESEEIYSGKLFSKVEPLPPKKQKKSVRFSDQPPAVHVFEIEEGNKMKKTSLARTALVDTRQTPVFSLEKITLMKILRWNPHWLDEQVNNNEPPPILGHNNLPMSIFHSFNNHNQYVQLVGDLLLMEIWECLTQGHNRKVGQPSGIQMRIASLPPVPAQDRAFELYNLSVDVSVPISEVRTVPRMGEVLSVSFGPENARNMRFFYVHNVRNIPAPPNNRNAFFCISLHTCYTEKMKSLKPGELMIGVSLAYIQKELMLFEAMEYLASSPLSEAILRPESRHFVKTDLSTISNLPTQWTKTLNPSQRMAVHSSVSAALGDRPCIQMVQGPPGTGKSSVICTIVMTYFYDSHGRRAQNRGKILICATSNAAVDELVCRLLNIRQKLPKEERFRMVRVGRAEAMHVRALDISSQQLAQRDAAARMQAEPALPGRSEEISHLEAKINMWKTQEQDAKDPVRAAYCKGRVTQLINRLNLVRGGGGGGARGDELPAEQLAAAERRIIEGADIIVTTLASAHNHKMRGLRGRIALCIVDEAGQAIEPEALVPLTLDVTRLTLIGDPQQLPGFICSQRAKKHGLGESLFARLTSCAEQWPEGSPVVLLNQQYRMQAEIADYPNRAFYGGRVLSVPPPRPLLLPVSPYTIVCISSGDKGQGTSGANEMEAWGVSRLVLALHAALRPAALSLAVITPYNAHKDLIKKNLRLLQDPSEGQIEVNTVDSFQGQERDVVVVSLARSQGMGFLTDAGRMNVMLTRARHALLVCLNPHAMLKNYQWRTLVEDAQKRNLYRILPNKMCQGTSIGPIPHANVLKFIAPQNK